MSGTRSIRRVEWGLYRFDALTNAEQLREEGEAMQHCVGTYPDYCPSGVRRIYSVRERKSGRRVATFSLEYVNSGDGTRAWVCDQLSGLKNAEVVQKDLVFAADAVLRAYFDLPVHDFAKPVLPVKTVNEEEGEWCFDF